MTQSPFFDALEVARDSARSAGFFRLAEHLDDALLMAASERCEAIMAAASMPSNRAALRRAEQLVTL